MKKSSSALAFLLAFVLAATMALLVACGGGTQSSQAKETLSVSSEPTTDQASVSSSAVSTDPFYVLVVGDDSREGTVNKKGQYADGKGRSDTLMVVRVDPANYQLTLVTISRDTQAMYEGEKVKINETYHRGGVEALLDAVNDLIGVRPQYYLITTFVEFEKLVDDLGGLTIRVPVYMEMPDIVTNDQVYVDAGDQTLDGKQALVYARERHAYDAYGSGEAFRQTNDRRILQRLIEQILESKGSASDVAEGLLGHVSTNWDKEELLEYAKYFAANAGDIKFIRCTGPYDGGLDYETQLWLATRDEDAWARIMAIVDKGGDPAEVVPEPISPEQNFM